jgi:hypothetical protein
MATWKITRDWTFEGPAEAGADCDGGMGFALEPESGGEERNLAVQYARGPGPAPSSAAMTKVARGYLDEAEPPRYVTLGRDGNVIRAS